MNKSLAYKLRDKLKERCPVDTGQLKGSIQLVQLNNVDWLVIIGNNTATARDIPSNEYASKTNDAKILNFMGRTFPNPNFHWVNDAIEEWARENSIEISQEQIDLGDEEDES